MDRCKHVGRLRLAPDHSILNPQKWHCVDCNTSESIWACLGCAHVACGRYIEEHALQHFQQQHHPLAIEVNELYVFCYLCDDYVLNDNATGDLKLLRSTLSAIQSQRYEVTTRSGRTLRSASGGADAVMSCGARELQLRDEDRMFTALWHRRRALMGRVFRFWFGLTECGKKREEEERKREEEEEQKRQSRERRRSLKRQLQTELENAPLRKSCRLRRKSQKVVEMSVPTPPPASRSTPNKTKKKPAPPPTPSRRTRAQSPRRSGRTKKRPQTTPKPQNRATKSKPKTPAARPRSTPTPVRRRQSTKQNGSPFKRRPTVTPGVTGLRNLGNTCYMNSILQVLSHLHVFRECFLRLDLTQALELLASAVHGQLAVKSSLPQSPLSQRKGLQASSGSGAGLSGGASRTRSMELIQPKEPSSKHISLCHELHTLFQVMWSGKWALVSPFAMLHSVWQLIPAFRGYAQQDAQEFLCELLDKVQHELESTGTHTTTAGVPQKRLIKQVLSVVNTIFHGQLLSQVTCLACDHRSNTVEPFWDLSLEFPERYHSNSRENAQASCHLTEMLAKFTETEALEGNIYACDHCNAARRRSSSKPILLTEASKQLMVHKLPQVLRLHLKRFRWSGRNHREKIGVHVSFDQLLNMEPYCCREPPSPKAAPCPTPTSPSSTKGPSPRVVLPCPTPTSPSSTKGPSPRVVLPCPTPTSPSSTKGPSPRVVLPCPTPSSPSSTKGPSPRVVLPCPAPTSPGATRVLSPRVVLTCPTPSRALSPRVVLTCPTPSRALSPRVVLTCPAPTSPSSTRGLSPTVVLPCPAPTSHESTGEPAPNVAPCPTPSSPVSAIGPSPKVVLPCPAPTSPACTGEPAPSAKGTSPKVVLPCPTQISHGTRELSPTVVLTCPAPTSPSSTRELSPTVVLTCPAPSSPVSTREPSPTVVLPCLAPSSPASTREPAPNAAPCPTPPSPKVVLPSPTPNSPGSTAASHHPKHFLYDLSAVVMHHGKGFGSGHYTSYCYNKEGGFWVHCNDSKLNVCSVDEVCRAQAYILFYTQRVTQDKDRPL